MNQKEYDIQHKLRILKRAEETGHAAKTCRSCGVTRVNLYRGGSRSRGRMAKQG